MPRAVRFDRYGDVDVLNVVDVTRPVPGAQEVLVRMKAAGINPGEASIRKGLLHALWPATFPSGEGTDLAGVVEEVGAGVTAWRVGDEVLGFTNRWASHAELVLVEAGDLTAKPAGVSWDAAGALFVAGTTAYAAVRAVSLRAGDTVVVSGAAGGVGCLAVQLAKSAGATVLGLASEKHPAWLASHGVTPVVYGDGAVERIRAASHGRVDAFIDTYGQGYVKLAIDLGVAPDRIDTIIDWDTAKQVGAKTEGNAAAGNSQVLAELAAAVAEGRLEVPIAKTFPLSEVRAAFRELEQRHTMGKIVLCG
jgi:NADPH:quinone reductase-like Zn-dependent oxidoreductase